MDIDPEYVDRNELRRRIETNANGRSDTAWRQGRSAGQRHAIDLLNAMPAASVPRGWSRDELLAAMDAEPGTVVERLTMDGLWSTLRRVWVERWPDDVVSYDVRVVAPPEPKTEDVPLHEVVGRTTKGDTEPVQRVSVTAGGTAYSRGGPFSEVIWFPLPVRLAIDGDAFDAACHYARLHDLTISAAASQMLRDYAHTVDAGSAPGSPVAGRGDSGGPSLPLSHVIPHVHLAASGCVYGERCGQ